MTVSKSKLERFRRKILAAGLDPGYLLGIGRLYLEQRPDDAEVLRVLAELATERNDPVFVDRCCRRLIELGAVDESVYLRQLETLLRLGNVEAGRALCREAEDDIRSERGLAILHKVATGVGEYGVSLRATERLLDGDRSDPARWSGHGTALQHAGDLAAAEGAYRRALELNGDSPVTRFLLSACRKYTTTDNNIDDLREAITRVPADTLGWQQLAYALAKELEDTEQFDEAFAMLSKGSMSVRKSIDYTVDTDRRMCELLLQLHDSPGSSGVSGSHKPVFILGMPRTGSTLTERILSSHSRVVSQGETNGLLSSLRQALGVPQANTLVFQRLIEESTGIDYGAVGRRYLDYVEPRNADSEYFIEKLPQNSFLAGLILRAFTDARIIYTDRNPMDACFSNFKQLFNPGFFPYSYDLAETAAQYDLVHDFVAHWCDRDPQRVTVINYDRLVSDPHTEIGRLLDFLGLQHEVDCFAPEKNTAGLSTASFSQARQPIYRSSSEKWRRFERHLGVLKSHFGVT